MSHAKRFLSGGVLFLVWFSRLLAVLSATAGVVYVADYWLEPETIEEAGVRSIGTDGKLFATRPIARLWLDSKHGCESDGVYIVTSESPVCAVEIELSNDFAAQIEKGDTLLVELTPLFGHAVQAVQVGTDIKNRHTPFRILVMYLFCFAAPTLIIWRNTNSMDRSEKLKKSLAALFISLFMMVFAMAEFYFIRIGY